MKRVTLLIAIGVFFSNCTQYSSFLGPTYTIATTGNVYQAGLYYHSNTIIKKKTGKNTLEHASNLIEQKNTKINLDENLIALVETNIKVTRNKIFPKK